MTRHVKSNGGSYQSSHPKCAFTIRLKEDVHRILDKAGSGMLDSHREHLKQQYKSCTRPLLGNDSSAVMEQNISGSGLHVYPMRGCQPRPCACQAWLTLH